jgi:hypothetical protein
VKTRLAIVLGFFALVGLALVLMPESKTAAVQKRTLPDGTILTLEQVTYGQQHNFYFHNNWWTSLWRGLPRSLQRFAPRGGNMTSTSTRTNGIVFWMSRFDPKLAGANRGYVNVGTGTHELQLVDEHGCAQRLGGYSSSGDGKGKLINAFGLDIFPRRQKSFKLIMRDTSATGPKQIVAEFEVPNPGPTAHPTWKPEGIPQSRTNGGLEFVFNRWRTGTYNGQLSAHPDYEIREHGVKRTDWASASTEYRDASGNENWQSLCTNETAWRLETQFRRTAEAQFAPEEIWAVKNLPVLGSNQIIVTNLSAEVLGVGLKLFAFGGPGSYTFTNGVLAPPGTVLPVNFHSTSSSGDGQNSWKRQSAGNFGGVLAEQFDLKQVRHFLIVDEGIHDNDLSLLVRGRDDQGRPIEVGQRGYDNRRAILSLTPKSGAQRMDLEFIINRGRTAEFLVAPPVAENKKRR